MEPICSILISLNPPPRVQGAIFDRARPFLAQMGKNVVNCGRVGNGQAAKICNNMLLGIEMIGVAETMNLGIRLVEIRCPYSNPSFPRSIGEYSVLAS